jgi:O-antigen/teichoic acid export membrane protein
MFKSAVKFLVKDSAIYGIAGAVNKLLAVFTVPIVVRVLTKEEFGITSTVIGLSTFFVGFIMLGMDSSIARWFFDNETDDINYKKKVTSIGFFVQLISLAICLLIFYFLKDIIGEFLFDGNFELIKYWKMYMFSIPATAFLLFSNNLFKWSFQRNKYLIISIGNAVTTVSLTLIFVLIYDMNISGVILAPVLSSSIFSLLGLYLGRGYLTTKNIWDVKLAKEMLKYGLPFAGIMIIGSFLPSVDRLFLLRFVDMEAIGEYSVALKISGLLYLIVSAFQISFGPYAFSIWKKPEAKELFGKIMTLYFTLIISVGVFFVVFGDIAISVFAGKKYLPALKLLPILLIAISIKSLSEFSLLGVNWSKKTYYNIFTTIFQFLILILFNFLLTERFTLIGASISILISNVAFILITFYISNKFYKIEVDIKRIIGVLIIAILVHYLVLLEINPYLKYILIIPYTLVLYRIVLSKEQRIEILNYIKIKLQKN